jgi:hypothetical protein
VATLDPHASSLRSRDGGLFAQALIAWWVLLLVASLDARLLEQLAVLLLRHPLTPLLNDRTHAELSRLSGPHCCRGDPAVRAVPLLPISSSEF